MIMSKVIAREGDVIEQSAVPSLQASVETAPAEVAYDGPIRYDNEFNYYFLLLGLVFVVFCGLWYWIHRRAEKRRQRMGPGDGSRDADGFENISWTWELPTLPSRSDTAVSESEASLKSADDKGKKAVATREGNVKVTTGNRVSNAEATPWEAYDGAPFDGRNRVLVPLRAHYRLSDEELARRHTPIVVSTCSGQTTPKKYLTPDYIRPNKAPKTGWNGIFKSEKDSH